MIDDFNDYAVAECDPAFHDIRVRSEWRPPSFPHSQSQAERRIHLHAVRTGGRTDQHPYRVSLF